MSVKLAEKTPLHRVGTERAADEHHMGIIAIARVVQRQTAIEGKCDRHIGIDMRRADPIERDVSREQIAGSGASSFEAEPPRHQHPVTMITPLLDHLRARRWAIRPRAVWSALVSASARLPGR